MKPILFNTKMVRAILDGRKTVTRRVMKEPPPNVPTAKFRRLRGEIAVFAWDCSTNLCERKAPYQPGDILYIRETWCKLPVTPGGHARGHDLYYYKADGDYRPEQCRGAWKPSIHMPKEAARLFLRVTEVRAERLQDITSEGKTAEGMNCGWQQYNFCELWDSTIKPADLPRYGWEANPWVWTIEFERVEKDEALNSQEGWREK